MSNLYAVHGGASIYALVKAKSEHEALNVFAKSQIDDEYFRSEIDTFVVNAGLLADFYKDEHGSFYDNYTGEYSERIKTMKEKDREAYIEFHIEKNARAFWQNTPPYADMYMKELKSSWGEEDYKPNFTENFYIETIKVLINSGSWYDDFGIVKVDTLENDCQIIYRD